MADMQPVYKDIEAKMTGALDSLGREFAAVRTGRASATCSTGSASILRHADPGGPDGVNLGAGRAKPRDPAVGGVQLKAIEKAIIASDLGLTPVNDGKIVPAWRCRRRRERRKQAAKTVHKVAEDVRVVVRNVRREANDRLQAMAKDKKISEDEERRGHDQIQKTTDRFIAKVDELLKKKEQEILSF